MRCLSRSILVLPVLARLSMGCGDDYDRSKDPRFAPSLTAESSDTVCEKVPTGEVRLRTRLEGVEKRATFYCNSSSSAWSCGGGSDNPDDCEKSTLADDFGPQWGSEDLRRDLPTRATSVVGCPGNAPSSCSLGLDGRIEQEDGGVVGVLLASGSGCAKLGVSVSNPSSGAEQSVFVFPCCPVSNERPDAGVDAD